MKAKPIFRKIGWRMAVRFLFAMVFTTGCAWAQPTDQISPDMIAIQGRWIRTDAPYIIELSHAGDSSLHAAYYNPRPIHVERTEFAEQNGHLQLMIELQDVNYPGSTYFLAYDRAHDLLGGYYVHPVSQQTFEVEFVRQIVQ